MQTRLSSSMYCRVNLNKIDVTVVSQSANKQRIPSFHIHGPVKQAKIIPHAKLTSEQNWLKQIYLPLRQITLPPPLYARITPTRDLVQVHFASLCNQGNN